MSEYREVKKEVGLRKKVSEIPILEFGTINFKFEPHKLLITSANNSVVLTKILNLYQVNELIQYLLEYQEGYNEL